MSYLQRSSINMISSVAGCIILMVVNFATTPFLLRMLGEAAYGLQSLVGVIIGYLAFLDMGLDLPIAKFLAEDCAQKDIKAQNLLLSTTLQIYAVIGVIGMIIIMFSAGWLAKSVFSVPEELIAQAVTIFRLAGLGFLGSVGMSWGLAVMMGSQRFDLNYSVSVILSTAAALIGLGVVYAGYGLVGYVVIRVIFNILGGPIYFLLVRKLFPCFHFYMGLHKTTIQRIIGYLGYGTINRITRNLLSNLDKALIGIWVGVAAVGIYAVPFLVIQSISSMITFAFGFICPMTSGLQSLGQKERLHNIFIRASGFNAAITCLIFVPLLILGDLFMKIWLPDIATKTMVVLRLLSMAGFISALTVTLIHGVLVGLGGIRIYTIYFVVRYAALSVFLLLLVKTLGINGAGWAVLLTCSVDIIYFIIIIRNYLKISLLNLLRLAYFKPLLMGVILAGAAFLTRPLAVSWAGFAAIGLGLTLIFIVSGYILKVFGETEKRAVMGLLLLAKAKFIKC